MKASIGTLLPLESKKSDTMMLEARAQKRLERAALLSHTINKNPYIKNTLVAVKTAARLFLAVESSLLGS